MGAIFRKLALRGRDPVIITVSTGDIKTGGTDNDVLIRFIDTEGQESKTINLDNIFRDDFEPGRTDEFVLPEIGENVGEISAVEIWRKGFFDDKLFLNVIVVQRVRTDTQHVFPVHRWIPKDERLCVREFDSFLPQNDPDPERRKKELKRKREQYIPDVKAPGIPVQCKELPPDQGFSADDQWDLKARRWKLILISKLQVTKPAKNWKSLEDIKKFYTSKILPLPKPAADERYMCDEYFGEQRLSGCNPIQIRLCTAIPSKFAVTSAMIEPFLEGKTLSEAMERKRVFLTDYAVLNNLDMKPSTLKIVAPFGLFYLNDAGLLLPVAIQLQQDPGDNNPVFLPSDPPFTWTIVKMWYNLADATVHQGKSHLGFTHLIAESIWLVTHRQLSPSHPVFRLLGPHFHYLLAINHAAVANLLAPGGYVDIAMTVGRIGIFDILRKAMPTWHMNVDGTLPEDIKERGVGPDVLPHYPYRDDGMPVYYVIRDYVKNVILGNYDSDEALLQDEELQAWAEELQKPFPEGGVGIQGVPGYGKITNIEDLVDILTSTIFLSSAQHAAGNFNQYEQYGFPALYPTTLKGDPPTTKEPLTEKDMVNALPGRQMTAEVMMIAAFLSGRGTNSLGDFEVTYAYDEIAQNALKIFREDLKKARNHFLERNEKRKYPYTVLDPADIPNAISI